MAKVFGPCFSLSASKTLKKLLVFKRKKGVNIVGRYHKPGSKTPTSLTFGQACQRADIAFLVAAWQGLSADEKQEWDDNAKSVGYIGTGYHYFIHKTGGNEMSFFRRIKIWDGITEWLIDKIGAGVLIDQVHHEVHEGKSFTTSDWQASIADEAKVDYLIRTPDSDIRGHMEIVVAASLAGKVELFEGPDISADGNVITPFVNNRNSGNSSTLLFFEGPTIGGGGPGDRLEVAQMPAGSKAKLGGEARSESEWVLKKNTEYLLRFTSQANSNIISAIFEHYEHDKLI